MRILAAEIYNKQKKISLIFEHETMPDAAETERLKYDWKNKLKAGNAVQIEIRVQVPEQKPNQREEIPLPEEPPVFPQEEAVETVAVPFSIEEYEAAQKESIRARRQKFERLRGFRKQLRRRGRRNVRQEKQGRIQQPRRREIFQKKEAYPRGRRRASPRFERKQNLSRDGNRQHHSKMSEIDAIPAMLPCLVKYSAMKTARFQAAPILQ